MLEKPKEKTVIDENGQKKAVIPHIEDYEKLLEDLHDLAVLAERRGEKKIPPEKLEAKLKIDGLLSLILL